MGVYGHDRSPLFPIGDYHLFLKCYRKRISRPDLSGELRSYKQDELNRHINSNSKLTNQTKEANHGEKVPAFGRSASNGRFQCG